MNQSLILVDENDRQIGTGEKMEVHRKGLLHRCFSILIFNDKHEMLLQQRARTKYHSGGLWTNTCCGHPLDGEDTTAAAHRRLVEEMGFDCPLEERFSFIYKAALDHRLQEHEFDHVYFGTYNSEVVPNPDEADGFRWISKAALKREIETHPETYTVWSKIAFEKLWERF
jgi:isopentenyl-diphosphate delta-isomerase